MYQFFVNPYNAQIVSFVAKACVLTALSEMATLISYASTPKAFIFSYFTSFENMFTLLMDRRWRPSVRQHCTRRKAIKSGTWITIIVAGLFCTVALLSDLLLFQFTARREQYRIKLTRHNFDFEDTTIDVGEMDYTLPNVLLSNETAIKEFGNMTYLSDDGGQYMKYDTEFLGLYVVDGPHHEVNITNNITEYSNGVYAYDGPLHQYNITNGKRGVQRCVVTNMVDPPTAFWGLTPITVNCYVDEGPNVPKSIVNLVQTNAGYEGETMVTTFQSTKGAHYLFLNITHRTYEVLSAARLDNFKLTRVENNLESLTASGYALNNAVINGLPIAPVEYQNKTAVDLLQGSINSNKPYACTSGHSCYATFLFSKMVTSYKYGTYPIHTRKYFLCSLLYYTPDTVESLNVDSEFATMSYNSRQFFVKAKTVKPSLIPGFYVDQYGQSPVSMQIVTDRTDHEILLATLRSPNWPRSATPTEYQNAFPGFLVITTCTVFIVLSQLTQLVYRSSAHRRMPFDVNLEIYHKALENLNGLNAWHLTAKFELDDNIVMYQSKSQLSNAYTIGLVRKQDVMLGRNQLPLTTQPRSVRSSVVSGVSDTDSLMMNAGLIQYGQRATSAWTGKEEDKQPLVLTHF